MNDLNVGNIPLDPEIRDVLRRIERHDLPFARTQLLMDMQEEVHTWCNVQSLKNSYWSVFRTYSARVKSFQRHYADLGHDKIQKLARAGFAVSSRKQCLCYHCGFNVSSYMYTVEDPLKFHRENVPLCAFVEAANCLKPCETPETVEKICKICLTNEPTVAALPCGHVQCPECLLRSPACPFCKQKVQGFVRVYFG